MSDEYVTRPTVTVPSPRRSAVLIAAALFWGWLLARWVNDWLLPAGIGVPPGQPFVSPASISAVADSLVGTSLAPLAGPLDDVAFSVAALPALAAGVWLTIVLTVASVSLGFALAVPISVVRVYGGRGARWLALSYTELIRGTPLLAQLFVLFFGLGLTRYIRAVPGVGQGFVPDQAVWVAIIGFVINSSAYQSEYLRSALVSVDPGQLTAARSVGLSRVAGLRFVVLPQALRYAIPAWTNELIYLIKYSSLAAFITVPELFFRANAIASETFRYTLLFTLVALFYLALVVSASGVMTLVESRTSIPGIGYAGPR
jgi:polar amino acid transport system permease protein